MQSLLGNFVTDGSGKPFRARRSFFLTRLPKRAVVRVCGLGQFLLYCNGKKVGDHELDPGWTAYDKYIQYVEFDLKGDLRTGENVLAAEVGNGWFRKDDTHYTFAFPPFMPPNPNPYVPFGESLPLAFALELRYPDGQTETLTAGEGCFTAPCPTVMSNVYGSETVDLRLEQPGWSAPGFDAADWTPARPYAGTLGEPRLQTQPPIRVLKRYQGRYLHSVNGRDVYDFGQNMSGILEFSASGPAGAEVRIYPAEKLTPEGDADQVAKNWCTVDSRITAILGPGEKPQRVRMRFTYFAGRYAAVERDPGVTLESITADAVSAAWREAGGFLCSDPRLQAIYDMVERSVEANLLSVHTDCPTIERFAWQEPNHLMAPSIFYMKDGKALWEKYLTDLRLEQHGPEDCFRDLAGKPWYPGAGLVPSQAPCYIHNVLPVPGMGSFYDIIPWGSTCILGTWWHYMFYGDEGILRANYETGLRYLDHLKTKRNGEGFLNHGLGDWGNPKNLLARENVETAFLYADAVTLERMALILGRDAEAATLRGFSEEVRENYNEKLLVWNGDLGCWCYRCWDHPGECLITQAAEALPLYWGMVPAEKEADVVRAFRAALAAEGAFVSGEIGLPYIIQTARKYSMNDLIFQYITRETHPSYYAFVLDGETTLGEYWEHNPRSHCHDMMGHITEWYYNGLAGLEPVKPGFGEVRIHPWMPEGMERFSCWHETPFGRIEIQGMRRDGRPVYSVRLPEGVRCLDHSPQAELQT